MQVSHLLQFVVVNDILIGRAALQKSIEPVHMMHVPPEVHQSLRYLKVCEVLASDPDMLQPRHQLAVKAAHSVAGKEARAFTAQMLIDLAQMCHQRR